MVRATDLQEVPYFLVLTEAKGFQGKSWIVQVQILEQEMLWALPVDEEPVLVLHEEPVLVLHENGNPLMFDFFGLGQHGLTPHQ
jgi:hypothetical protein